MVFVNISEMSQQYDMAEKKSVIVFVKCKTHPLSKRGRFHVYCAEVVSMQVKFEYLNFENVI